MRTRDMKEEKRRSLPCSCAGQQVAVWKWISAERKDRKRKRKKEKVEGFVQSGKSTCEAIELTRATEVRWAPASEDERRRARGRHCMQHTQDLGEMEGRKEGGKEPM